MKKPRLSELPGAIPFPQSDDELPAFSKRVMEEICTDKAANEALLRRLASLHIQQQATPASADLRNGVKNAS